MESGSNRGPDEVRSTVGEAVGAAVGEAEGPDGEDDGVVLHPARRREETISNMKKKTICFMNWNTTWVSSNF
jgi:hypothetical protein